MPDEINVFEYVSFNYRECGVSSSKISILIIGTVLCRRSLLVYADIMKDGKPQNTISVPLEFVSNYVPVK